jgi:MYXO-CTERM domain-containing protein
MRQSTVRPRFSAFSLALALALASAGASAAEIRKGPYLQALGQTAVTVKVEMGTPETVTVDVTGPDGFKASRTADMPRRFQALRIEGLKPATTYEYRVSAPGTSSEPARFTTAPPDNRPYRFVLYGDSRSDPAAHLAVMRGIEATAADFLVQTGDMVYSGGDEEEWQDFFKVEGKLLASRSVFAAVGNHELLPDSSGSVAFLRYFASVESDGHERPQLYGSFRWSNTRFFLLNAMDNWSGDERAWLRAELSAAMTEPGLVHRFAVLHHGPFSSGRHGGNTRLIQEGIVTMLRDHKVDLIMAGHDHIYERGEGQGLKYVISGGAGAPLYAREHPSPETAYFESVHHYVEMAVDGEKVEMVAKRAIGSVIERCSFTGSGPWSCEAGEAKKKPATTEAPPPQKAGACACSMPGTAERASGGLAALLGLSGALALRRRHRNDPDDRDA